MKFGWIVPTCVALVLYSTVAQAGNPREHDGFFLRMSVGGGHADTELEEETAEAELSGIAGDYNFAVGGVVAQNLAIHGTFFGWGVEDPDFELSNEGGLEEEAEVEGRLSMAAIGAGITYYLMPINIYFSGSIGGAKLYLDLDELGEMDSDIGIAGDLTIGKEWWVGNSWGLGVAGGMSLHSIPADDVDENFTGKSFVIRFSSTFN
jgi:hypothetical protein